MFCAVCGASCHVDLKAFPLNSALLVGMASHVAQVARMIDLALSCGMCPGGLVQVAKVIQQAPRLLPSTGGLRLSFVNGLMITRHGKVP